MIFELGNEKDIDELEQLYDILNDYLEAGVNYPGWRKGVYPTREEAVGGVSESNLYVLKDNGKIIGSVILNHKPEAAYEQAQWAADLDDANVFVIHTFVVHPNYMKAGIGKKLMDFAIARSQELHMKSIRLDVYEKNIPAIRLYEKCGFKYTDTVDLGLGEYGLHWFKLYEKLL